MSIEKILPELYYKYGEYRNKKQMLPRAADGCIPVWRRCLLGVHEHARTGFKKSASLTGYVMLHYHPHAEPYDVLVLLVQNKFILGQGQWGSRIGMEDTGAADKRYTEIKANPFIEKLAFEYIDHVDWVADELDPEPVYLPTMIPFCLFPQYEFNTIGFGFKPYIPNFHFNDLVSRLLYLLKETKTCKKISPNIIGCDILSTQKELESVLTSSESTINISGQINEDEKNFKIYLRGWSPRQKFKTIFSEIDKNGLISSGNVICRDMSTGKTGTNILFEVAKSRNRTEVYDAMRDSIKASVTKTLKYQIYAISDNNKIIEPSVDDMLLNTWKNYKNAYESYLNNSIAKIQIQIEELNVIQKIKPYINDAIKLNDFDKSVQYLSEKSKISIEIIVVMLEKYKIKRLLTTNTDQSELIEKVNEYKAKLENVDSEIISKYKNILKGV